MIIGERICTITFDEYDKQALERTANILGNIADIMMDDESTDNYFADDLSDLSSMLFRWADKQKAEIKIE